MMKRDRVGYLAVLMIGLATASSSLMAQSTPVPAAAVEVRATNATAFRSSEKLPYPSPILPYARPTEKEKLRQLGIDSFGPFAIITAALAAGIQQDTKSPPEWGGRWEGFGKRTGSDFGVELVTTMTRYGIAEIFREDDRYYPSERRGLLPRVGHAVISTLTGRRGADGHTVFSLGGLISPYVGSMTALAWYPQRYGGKDGFRWGNYNLGSQALANLWVEFIYGGPHTLMGHLRRGKTPDPAAAPQNP